MSRATLVLNSTKVRERALSWCRQAPWGTRIEFKATKRSLPQNSIFWAMLSDIAAQKEHMGRKYSPDIWKLLFLDAFGRETKFVPSLDGSTVVPIGQSSSDLSKDEMSSLIDFMSAWGAENSVEFHVPSSELSKHSEGMAA